MGAPLDNGLALDRDLAAQIVDAAMARYFAARRARIEAFVDRHFTLAGTLRLHRHALGWDLLKAPVNLALVLPTIGLRLAGASARRLGARRVGVRLSESSLFLRTRVGAELEWLVTTELLELPCASAGRASARDALAEQILADPLIAGPLSAAQARLAAAAGRPELRRRLAAALATYAGSRAAVSDIATAALTVGVGGLAFKQFTTGALSFGPALAAALAQQMAIAAFPLGAGAGALWYAVFPPAVPTALLVGATVTVLAASSVLAAFAGIAADPLQRRLGLHRRRLARMLQVLERQFRGDDEAFYAVKDHYIARLIDLFELLRGTLRALP